MDGEGFFFGYIDAWTFISSFHAVGCVISQDDDGIAQTGDARPLVVIVVGNGGDVGIAEGHRGAVVNADMGVLASDASECVAVIKDHVSAFLCQRHQL